jgi:thioredoxin reductase
MALGRSLRKVLIIDSGMPCNRRTPHSHNFITQDGNSPAQIAALAKQQVLKYPTIAFENGLVIKGKAVDKHFEIELSNGKVFTGKKLLFTTGVKDVMPAIPGFAECWGISVLHCPYCHGYEVRNEPTGILANAEMAFELTRLIHHWTKDLILFTNGPSFLTIEQTKKIKSKGIQIIETVLEAIQHTEGYVDAVQLIDGQKINITTIYARPEMLQHCSVPQELGCEMTKQHLVVVDLFQRTSVTGVYAAGDNTNPMRSVSIAVASGGFAGASINRDLIEEAF